MSWSRLLRQTFSGSASSGRDAKAMVGPSRDLNDPEIGKFLRGGPDASAGAVVNQFTTLQEAVAWRCVTLLSSVTANLPIDLILKVDERQRKTLPDHPLAIVLTQKPNSWQSPYEWRRMMQAHLLLRGNAYSHIVWSLGRVIQLIPLHPDRMAVEQQADLSIRYTYTRADGSTVVFAPGEILHLRGMSLDGIVGVSLLTYARKTLGLSIQGREAGAKFFTQGHVGRLGLKHPGKLSDLAHKHLVESWEEVNGGVGNAHRPVIFEEGMEAADIGFNAEDIQFLESRKFERGELLMFFGVPPFIVGDTEKVTSWGSGIEQQMIGFVTFCVADWTAIWEGALTRDLLVSPGDRGIRILIRLTGLLKGDIRSRYAAYQIGRQGGWLSVNEIRAFEDMEPIEGGDTYLTPLNMAPVSDPANTDPANPANQDNPNDPAQSA